MKTVSPLELRRRYTDETLRYLPRLFQMVDRNRYSPTYGCFDRSYWHYRTMDFPSGMYQEFSLPLALAATLDFPDNPYQGSDRVRELALAGIDFARISAHSDGTCDDYFPYERALGALVFSLNACTETALLLGDKRPETLAFAARRADYLRRHNETGRLSNHQALAALALYNTFMLTGEERFRKASDDFVQICRDWFNPDEGWFWEYEGADPGYQSCTVAFLAKLHRKSGDKSLLQMLNPAVDFCSHFMHPDGSYAGEYGSRNTYHFYAHGFELMAPRNPRAAQIADQFLTRGLPNSTRYFNDDDRMCAHYLYDWMEAWRDFSPTRAATPLNAREPYHKYFEKARMYVVNTPRYHAVLSLLKGGVLKVVSEKGTIHNDTGIIAETDDHRVIVSHLVDDYAITADIDSGRFAVTGAMCRRKAHTATPFTQILFRLLNLTLGRFAPNLLRGLLQKILITGKTRTEYTFERVFEFGEDGVRIINRLTRAPNAPRLARIHIGSDATSIYVANSNVFQKSVLKPWSAQPLLLDQVNNCDMGEETMIVRVTDR
ncbi:hypothetical protein CVU37_14220 [candidate division BRC1 bacterium HGW-BRC1-1]|jgi:hypothetical protein|nr:MAG: hypothetical protein CVU37_14220 [candidate division BRC1 bacterium HGW-BRC1-1]